VGRVRVKPVPKCFAVELDTAVQLVEDQQVHLRAHSIRRWATGRGFIVRMGSHTAGIRDDGGDAGRRCRESTCGSAGSGSDEW
jgi:hypothetical protein